MGSLETTHSIFGVDERVVDGDNLNLGVLDSVAEDDTANATEAVDANLDSHVVEWDSSARRARVSTRSSEQTPQEKEKRSKAEAGAGAGAEVEARARAT